MKVKLRLIYQLVEVNKEYQLIINQILKDKILDNKGMKNKAIKVIPIR